VTKSTIGYGYVLTLGGGTNIMKIC